MQTNHPTTTHANLSEIPITVIPLERSREAYPCRAGRQPSSVDRASILPPDNNATI